MQTPTSTRGRTPILVMPDRRRRVTKPWRRAVIIVVAVALAATGWSYARALTGPGNDALSIRSTEWLKDHYFAWAVNDVERWWYTHHQPRTGGVPTGALRHTIQPAVAPTAPTGPAPTPTVTAPAHLPAPAPLAPFAADALSGEGQWKPLGEPVHGMPAMYAAYLRPDATHTSLVTAVAWIDPLLVRFTGYAGALEPGGGPWTNRAPIPSALRPDLLAAFNSGFKMRDARGGYYADGHAVRPLVSGAATMVISPNGVPDIGEWGRDFTLGPSVAFARQNLALIVDGGRPVADLTSANAKWGATVGNAVYVWRSGVGITATGAIVYAAGSGLSASTLADVLTRAGAVRAMELDINSTWVDFFTYGPNLLGSLSVYKLLPDMRPSTSNYLTASSRDFIAVFGR